MLKYLNAFLGRKAEVNLFKVNVSQVRLGQVRFGYIICKKKLNNKTVNGPMKRL